MQTITNRRLTQLLLLASFAAFATACGGFFCQPNRPVLQSGEAIAFMIDGDRVTMHVQILYEGPAEGFSWVLPIPEAPDLSVGTDILFSGLFTSTLPTFTLDIIDELSETCPQGVVGFECDMMMMNSSPMADGAGVGGGAAEAVVLEEGFVGPFDFVVLEAANNDPTSVFRWLEENGYDQPDEAAALLNYYASMGQKFVALRLSKTSETGEIEPLIIQYQMPGGVFEDESQVSVARRALACVPIQLTRIAATDNMPITVSCI